MGNLTQAKVDALRAIAQAVGQPVNFDTIDEETLIVRCLRSIAKGSGIEVTYNSSNEVIFTPVSPTLPGGGDGGGATLPGGDGSTNTAGGGTDSTNTFGGGTESTNTVGGGDNSTTTVGGNTGGAGTGSTTIVGGGTESTSTIGGGNNSTTTVGGNTGGAGTGSTTNIGGGEESQVNIGGGTFSSVLISSYITQFANAAGAPFLSFSNDPPLDPNTGNPVAGSAWVELDDSTGKLLYPDVQSWIWDSANSIWKSSNSVYQIGFATDTSIATGYIQPFIPRRSFDLIFDDLYLVHNYVTPAPTLSLREDYDGVTPAWSYTFATSGVDVTYTDPPNIILSSGSNFQFYFNRNSASSVVFSFLAKFRRVRPT